MNTEMPKKWNDGELDGNSLWGQNNGDLLSLRRKQNDIIDRVAELSGRHDATSEVVRVDAPVVMDLPSSDAELGGGACPECGASSDAGDGHFASDELEERDHTIEKLSLRVRELERSQCPGIQDCAFVLMAEDALKRIRDKECTCTGWTKPCQCVDEMKLIAETSIPSDRLRICETHGVANCKARGCRVDIQHHPECTGDCDELNLCEKKEDEDGSRQDKDSGRSVPDTDTDDSMPDDGMPF